MWMITTEYELCCRIVSICELCISNIARTITDLQIEKKKYLVKGWFKEVFITKIEHKKKGEFKSRRTYNEIWVDDF